MPIKVLPPEIVARIAAGEVVERPASVVKELLENALDAAATEINIDIEGAGLTLIRVADNGSGIPAGEMGLVLGRHATSKITNIEDLDNITTLGFRGEALPSIVSVADTEILSRTRAATAGHYLNIRDGVTTEGIGARAVGTTISVKNLFRRVPARLKFLKSAATETARLTGVVSQYALGYPEIKITLSLNSRTVLRTPGNARLADIISQVYGPDHAREMFAIPENTDENTAVLITGLVGSPRLSRNTNDQLSFFVNRRWVISRLLVKAVEEAYHGLLMTGKHPVAVVDIFIPPSDIDVNIHPAKTEIKFRDEHVIFGTLEKLVRRSLITGTGVPEISGTAPARGAGVAENVRIYRGENSPVNPGLPSKRDFPFIAPVTLIGRDHSPLAGVPEGSVVSPKLPLLRIMGQAMGTYIVAEGPDGLYIIDQHAAHERILFEKLNKEKDEGVLLESQGLLEPYPLDLSPADNAVLNANLDYLGLLGFTLEPFGTATCLVRSVPAVIAGGEWPAALSEILQALGSRNITRWRENIAVSLACHSAVRAGKMLTDPEIEALIRQLEKTTSPLTCPHGRPTVIRLGKEKLEKDFGRT